MGPQPFPEPAVAEQLIGQEGGHVLQGHAADGFAAQAVALAANGQRLDVRGKLRSQLPVSRTIPDFL